MKNIIIVGYPKSGNTWVTRLTAELVGCPVVGFWQETHTEIAREGQGRVSAHSCYKAHQQLKELGIEVNSVTATTKVIYVVRDPRDIAISGANYFNFDKINLIEQFFRKVNKQKSYFSLFPVAETYQINRMIKAIIFGDAKLHKWLKVSWKDHYRPYLNAGILCIQYEMMLAQPERECKKILDYLNIQRDLPFVKQAIANQSFERKKSQFVEKGDIFQKNFLNRGQYGQWKNKLSSKQKQEILKYLKADLKFFGYEADSFEFLIDKR